MALTEQEMEVINNFLADIQRCAVRNAGMKKNRLAYMISKNEMYLFHQYVKQKDNGYIDNPLPPTSAFGITLVVKDE